MLLGIENPKGGGVLLKEQGDGNLKKTPNFKMGSAVNQPQVTEDAFALGADYFIMKPFDKDTIIQRIKRQEEPVPL